MYTNGIKRTKILFLITDTLKWACSRFRHMNVLCFQCALKCSVEPVVEIFFLFRPQYVHVLSTGLWHQVDQPHAWVHFIAQTGTSFVNVTLLRVCSQTDQYSDVWVHPQPREETQLEDWCLHAGAHTQLCTFTPRGTGSCRRRGAGWAWRRWRRRPAWWRQESCSCATWRRRS